ncbi:hypothetical protein TrispH2_002214 [Trichoplax sp. H2]|nr:hypothetical protein TrispH2_002214 [Trichoplax sp. H2]|eukprot:RDD45734.1 hypothetical protein TrispH2_002214 [Trichoplax sp. H2]
MMNSEFLGEALVIRALAWIVTIGISYFLAILMIAMIYECIDAVQQVIGNTANHSKDANNTFHQLMTVYQSERSEFLRVIKEQSIDVNKEMSPYGLSIFQWLCTKHDVIAIQYLIRECQGQVTAKTALGDTCLMLACAAYATNLTRKYRTVELLIMEGCDVNAKNWTNVTALNIATRMKDGKLWKILFKNG